MLRIYVFTTHPRWGTWAHLSKSDTAYGDALIHRIIATAVKTYLLTSQKSKIVPLFVLFEMWKY